MFVLCVPAVAECCQVMFDYRSKAEDELDLKKGDIVVILKKVELFAVLLLLLFPFSQGRALQNRISESFQAHILPRRR